MKYGIIAAGEGSRLQQEGVALPKPLVELDGRPMIRRLIDIFLNCGAEEICVIVNQEMREVQDYLRSLQLPVPLRIAVQSTPSSMHSMGVLAPWLRGGRFVLTTVDTIFSEADLRAYVEAFNADTEADGMMGVTDYVDDEKPLYVGVDAQGWIQSFDDAPNGSPYISAGIYGLDDRAIDVLEECLASGASRMRNFQRALLAAGLKLKAKPFGKVIDVDHASDTAMAKALINENTNNHTNTITDTKTLRTFMQHIKDFNELEQALIQKGERKRAAIVWAQDATTRAAAARALEKGLIEAIFCGCRAEIEADEALMAHKDHITIVDAADGDDAAAKAVAMARRDEVDLIVKGMLNTDNILRAVLNKEQGIFEKGSVLTHLTAASIPAYGKLLMLTDVAVIPYPNDEQRVAQVRYALDALHALGIEKPKVALIHCSEKVDARHFPFTGHYQTLKEQAAAGEFGECVIDGPYDVKVACSEAAMKKKHIESPLEGYSDALIFPDIEAGNTFYKTITLFAGADMAGWVVGAKVPIMVPSRGDSVDSKYHSLLMAILNA